MNTLENIADELHKPARRIFPRRKVITKFKDELWQADLIDMQKYLKTNNGFKYILIIIDTYTKYIQAVALKNKSANEVVKGMLIIINKVRPKLLQTDNGTEFYNKKFKDLMRKYNIKHYSTYSSIKAGMVERVIRTIKNKIYKHFTSSGLWNWYSYLPKVILEYNNSVHRSIKCTPNEAQLKPKIIKINAVQLKTRLKKHKFKVGDKVRISKYKHNFNKGYTPNWTTEVFTIYKILNTDPITYKLKDEKKKIILGCFYEQEIKKTKFPHIFIIERILKRRGNTIFVKWLGFDNKNNSWINKNNISK